MKINIIRLEKALVTEHATLARMFNSCYAGTKQSGTDAVKALVLEAKTEVYANIIKALQNSIDYE